MDQISDPGLCTANEGIRAEFDRKKAGFLDLGHQKNFDNISMKIEKKAF